MRKTVTILLSDKRSGSTLLERELCKHSAVNHVAYTWHSYNETHYWIKAACLLPIEDKQFYGAMRPGNYGSPSLVRKSLVNFLKQNVPDFMVPDTDEALVFYGWDALCKQFAHPIFFEKSPQHPHHWAALELLLSWIRTTDYQVKVIGLVRNPMSVMHSAFELFHTDPQERQFGWAHAYRNIQKFGELLSDDQFCFVRYEDIVAQPENQFERLCQFIGIEYDRAIGKSVHGDSISKWKGDTEYTLQLDSSIMELASTLGYSQEDLYNPPKKVPDYHQQILSRLLLEKKRLRVKISGTIERLKIRAGLSNK